MRDKLNREIYEYAIIRYLPKVEREEFINIGVILMCKRKSYLQLKFTIDEKRLRAFSEEVDVEMIADYLNAWEKVCAGAEVGGQIGSLELHVRFRWLTANRSTIIQSSAVHSGIGFEEAATLEDIFERYVRG